MVHRRESSPETPVREELSQLRADIDGLVDAVGRLAGDAGGRLVSGARRTAADVHARAGDAFDTALAQGRRTLKTVGKNIEAHPYLSLAVAAGLGLILGKLIGGRD